MNAGYEAVRNGAGLVHRSDRGRILVSGADRTGYLQGILTNDIAALAPGQGCYAAYLTPQGRMIADMQVLNLGERFLLIVHAAVKDAVLARMEEFVIMEDVRLEDWTAERDQIGIHGPSAARIVAGVLKTDAEPAAAPEHASIRGDLDGRLVLAVRSDDLGPAGFELIVERDAFELLWGALADAGAVPVDAETLEVLRLEAGRPLFTVDMDAETIPLEAGIEGRAISFTKGCYVGQEVVVRILHRGGGRVARRLVSLAIGPEGVPDRGARLVGPGGQEVGRVTSAARSPAGGAIALGYVRREFAEPGTRLDVEVRSGRLGATVSAAAR